MILNKGDTLEAELNFTKEGQPVDMNDNTIVVIVKKEWDEDEDALAVQILEPKEWKIEIELNGLDERGEFVIYIKSLDGDKKFTLKEIPLTIK